MALLGVRFVAEMGMLICLGIGGWQLGDGPLASAALGVVLPLVAAGVWSLWIAPRAPRRLRDPVRLAVEVTLFSAATLTVLGAQPSPTMAIIGLSEWVAFLISIPSRGHEPLPSEPTP